MAFIKNPLAGGGGGGSGLLEVTNGVIEQFKAQSGAIDANTFVEFVDSTTLAYQDRLTDMGGLRVQSIQINSSQVLLSFSGSDSNSAYPYVKVLTFSNGEITSGVSTQLASVSAGYGVTLAKLDDNKVLAMYGDSTLYARVCNFDTGTGNISFGTQVTIETENTSKQSMVDTVYLNKVVMTYHHKISYTSETKYYTRVKCATVSGDTISTATAVQTDYDSPAPVHIAAIDSTSLVGVERYYATPWALAGTTLTKGTAVWVGDYTSTMSTGSVKYVGDRFVIRLGSYSGNISVQVISEYQNNLSVSAIPIAVTTEIAPTYVGIAQLGNARALLIIGPRDNSKTDMSGYLIKINNINSMSVLMTSNLLTQAYGSVYDTGFPPVVIDNHVAIAGLGSDIVEAELDQSQKAIESTSSIKGITRTVVTDTSMGDVWVLDTSES